jgi:hypothetical protein
VNIQLDRWYTLPEVAAFLGLATNTVSGHVAAGKIPSKKRRDGGLPRHMVLGLHIILYKRSGRFLSRGNKRGIANQ